MQFQNAVITPQGRAILGAANTDKPITFTKFLFSSSPTRLTGKETELPEPTWGNGSVDAVVSQAELEQFVIYASATNNTDSGYACSYGIFATQDGVEHLIAVANCLGDPTHVTGSSEGYTRFHLALTIKYAVNANVLTVLTNTAGLISRGEFEAWTGRVVTTTSPSGAPYGEVQSIYGVKTFEDEMYIGRVAKCANVRHSGDYDIAGSIIPREVSNIRNDLGSSDSKWQNLYVENLHADYVNNKVRLILSGDVVARQTPQGTRVNIFVDSIISKDDRFLVQRDPNSTSMKVGEIYPVISRSGSSRGMSGLSDFVFYFEAKSAFILEPMTRVSIRFIGNIMNTEYPATYTRVFETIIGKCNKSSDGSVVTVSTGRIECTGNTDLMLCGTSYPSPQYIVVELELIR